MVYLIGSVHSNFLNAMMEAPFLSISANVIFEGKYSDLVVQLSIILVYYFDLIKIQF